jgi:hypothetical protein
MAHQLMVSNAYLTSASQDESNDLDVESLNITLIYPNLRLILNVKIFPIAFSLASRALSTSWRPFWFGRKFQNFFHPFLKILTKNPTRLND